MPFVVSVGAVVFCTVIVCVKVLVWPAQSVAVQVRVITSPQEEPGMVSLEVGVTVKGVPQASVAVTTGAAGTSE
jgi:hypothetical protein